MDGKIEGGQLGGQAGLQAPGGLGPREGQPAALLQPAIDRLDHLAQAAQPAAVGGARIGVLGQQRRPVIGQPVGRPVRTAVAQIAQIDPRRRVSNYSQSGSPALCVTGTWVGRGSAVVVALMQ